MNIFSTNEKAVAALIRKSRKISVLTGAGVSTDSGIPDFKTTDKEWKYPIPRHQAISLRFFRKDPETFWEIYRELFESKVASEPNNFHYYLAELEKDHDVTVMTQNVDGLHTKAGSTKVLEIHGSTRQLVCMKKHCRAVFPSENYLGQKVPTCEKCGSVLKPDVCLFDETVRDFRKAEKEVQACDLLIVAGTSLDVMPFNTLPYKAEVSLKECKRLWINRDSIPDNYSFTHRYIGSFKDFLEDVKE